MRKLKLFFACLLMAVLSIGQMWADPAAVGTTLFSEDFGSYSADDVPSGSVTTATGRVVYGGANVTYSCTDGGSTTKIYNQNTGGGTAPEILVSKSNGTFVIAGIPSGDAQAITVSWTQNKQEITVAASGTGYSGSLSGKPSAVGTRTFDITVADGADATFTLTFTGSGSSNVRVDDILVTVKTAGEGAAPVTPTCATPTFDPEDGETFTDDIDVEIAAESGTTIYYTINGNDPTTSSSVYSSALNFTETTTLKAMAVKEGSNNSAVATATYTKVVPFAGSILEIVKGDFNTTSYDANNGDHEKSGITFTTNKVYQSGSSIQFQKTNGLLYNKTDLGEIAKIEITTYTGKANNLVVYSGTTENPTSGAVTGSTSGSVTTYTFAAGKGFFAIKCNSTGASNVDPIKVYYTSSASSVAKPTISGDENFVGSTTVTITHADADAIYYTTDGSDPKTSGTKQTYSAPFIVNADGTTTVKAYAVKGSDASDVVSKEFTKVEALTTMAEVQAAATSTTDQSINVTISNWVVTAVSGNQVWLTDADNTKGILLYKSGHGFTAGKKLNGTVMGTKVKLYNLYPELTSLLASEVSVTDAEAVTPRTTTIAALTSGHPAEQGTVVKLEGVTFESSALSDGVNSIAADNKFFSSLALVEGTTYDITGVVTYYKNGDDAVVKIAPRSADDVEAKSSVVIPTAANLAALKAAERGTYILTLTNAVVTYVNGNNAFIEDATGGALIYFASHGYSAGDCLNGDYQVITTDYQGKFEITAMEPQAGAATTTADIPLTTVTIATLNANFSSYESRRIKIAGANVTDAISGSDRNGAINDGAALAVYAAVASTITLKADDNVDIIGYPGYYNTNQQFNVWQQSDITVNVKDPAGIAFTPESETITGGDSWSAPTFANPHSLDVTFSSNAEGVATVSNTGVVALAGGYGTAIITAHTDGDATYAAGNATYTITVNDPASVDTRKVAESPAAGFSSISGNLSGDEISFAAYKGGASNAPNGNNTAHELRLYKYQATTDYGGYITLKAKKGCLIDQVVITVSANCNVGYCKNTEALPTKESTPIAIGSSSPFDSGTGLDADSVRVANLDGSNQFKIVTITVYYNGDALAVDHYFLGGTYETTFEQNGTFDYTGLEVYASYDAGETITEPVEGFTVQADLSTAGEAKAEVYLNEVKIAEYDITVTAGKENPALAYTPASETITAGDAWSAPTLSNTFSVSPITYSSDKESVATVDENGVITLAGGYGTAVITAHFDETAAYVESEATYTITVNKPAPTPTSTIYRKVTATEDITDGQYLIVYEGDATHDAAVFDGSLENVDQAMKALAVEIVSDEIAGNTDLDAAVFTIDVTAGSLQSASGWYIGRADYSNGMDKSTTEAYVNTFAITDGAAVITGVGGCTLRYNYASDQLRFRYYKSGQQAIQLYKKETVTPPATKYTVAYAANGGSGDAPAAVEYEEGETFSVAAADLFTAPEGKEFDKWNDGSNDYAPGDTYTVGTSDVVLTAQWKDATPTPSYTEVRNGLTDGWYYTMCLDKAVTAVQGATIWRVLSKAANGTDVILEEVIGTLDAGRPYIFRAAASTLEVAYTGDAVGAPLTEGNNGLIGSFSKALIAQSSDNYIIYNNELYFVNSANVYVGEHRAYLDMTRVPDYDSNSMQGNAPRRRVTMAVHGEQVATGMDALDASEKPVKMVINGQLFILRGEKMYDATGRLVK